MNNLRPTRLKDIVGQTDIINMLNVMIGSAKIRGDVLPHILFDGPPGLGKTTLSEAIAHEMNCDMQIANGGAVSTIKSIVPYIMRISDNSILFIDEIHRIATSTSEFLYPIMEDFRCDLGNADKRVSYEVPRFTLIGATTESGSLAPPLYDRFGAHFHLEPYNVDELITLLSNNVHKLNLNFDYESIVEIAKRSRGVPRIANNLLRWVRDYCISKKMSLNANLVRQAMDLKGIDETGITPKDRKYLKAFETSNKPLGLNTIVSITGLDKQTIEGIIEPFLLRCGKIQKTSKGRVLA